MLIVLVNESDNYQLEQGYSNEFKHECLTMYVNGMGIRAIARVKKIHHTTIINWIKQVGDLLPNSYSRIEDSTGGKIR
ncbi:hypothetical protein CYANOKiyG1_16210 [Okeania sp. KiyG1]|nr:hypothetical protein CYANOKiyG1_16210 [Okeania sp. KiyG1]